ncbi:Fe2+-dependent dioxygenase [Janthinobacterium agaricidamnosum]|uniref:2OG-Fe(II) oxygenase superfamily protein n=1 Tax=Janthinobacterium agaricidamnosum NBRC 102515 = DSM 9628 TaxID=1349767 RepID=W0UZ06_9BURK|nr:Fe2+-dependent dioxygenase [Janthinobacterium agaricidamnosum]CDG80871.1 2OG-Fe(II) oxygenase superfamily protein [Janthinobacterium agaricidamnosum NBRC 102515 = DSM 9628]
MLLHLKQVLTENDVAQARALLQQAPWTDGRATSGQQAAHVKNNRQLAEQSAVSTALQQLVMAGLKRHPLFFTAALPKHISPPWFNCYSGAANSYGDHVDASVRYLSNGNSLRADLSCTLFLSDPDAYDGGELVLADAYREESIKLPAGDMILYESDRVHRVAPVRSGQRLASFFWIESMVRGADQRRLLFNMDHHLRQLRATLGETDGAVVGLSSTYHNLLRMWAGA